jgi:uncharacterized protein YcfJ
MGSETKSFTRAWCKVCNAMVATERAGEPTLAGTCIGALSGALLGQMLHRSLINTLGMAAVGGLISKQVQVAASLVCAECGAPVRRGEQAPGEFARSDLDEERQTTEGWLNEPDLGIERPQDLGAEPRPGV